MTLCQALIALCLASVKYARGARYGYLDQNKACPGGAGIELVE